VLKDEQNNDVAMSTNHTMSDKFKDYGARASSEVKSDAERANQEIQEQFYGETKEDNLSPFHVDINNPPLKK